MAALPACATAEVPRGATHPAVCRKVEPDLARVLLHKQDQDRVPVVVELSARPRARDVLWAGVADCIPSPSVAGASESASGVPWDQWEMAHPFQLPVMCVGWATRAEVAHWCGDYSVLSVEAWR